MDNQEHIFDEYGNYDFPTDTKQKGLNTVSSGAEKNKHFVEAKKMLDGKKFLLFSERLKLAEEYEEWVKKPLEDGSKIKDCALSVITFMQIKGFCKIPENAVVLTREEHQKYLAFKIIEPQVRGCLDREKKLEKQVRELDKELNLAKSVLSYADERPLEKWSEHLRKETAEKLAEMLKDFFKEKGKIFHDGKQIFHGLRVVSLEKIDEICKELSEGKV